MPTSWWPASRTSRRPAPRTAPWPAGPACSPGRSRSRWTGGRLNALVGSTADTLQLVSPLALLGTGAVLVLQGQLSLGAMVGLTVLGDGFLEPLAALVTTGLALQLLGSYMARINDVLDTPAEQ